MKMSTRLIELELGGRASEDDDERSRKLMHSLDEIDNSDGLSLDRTRIYSSYHEKIDAEIGNLRSMIESFDKAANQTQSY